MRYRLAVVALVVVCTVGMGAHYDTTFESHWPYPTDAELTSDYDTYVGRDIFLSGTVVAVDDGVARMRVGDDGQTFRIRSFDATVEPGGVVQVLGEVRPDGVLTADRVVVVNPSADALVYKYSVSLVGAAAVLVSFFRHWTVDVARLELEPRDG